MGHLLGAVTAVVANTAAAEAGPTPSYRTCSKANGSLRLQPVGGAAAASSTTATVNGMAPRKTVGVV
jgi:hypothetical protein